MSGTNIPQPEIGGDLLRVHRAISRSLDVSYQLGAHYAAEGYPDAKTRKGYITYVRCTISLLHAHHVTEDKAMFPYLHKKLPAAPYDVLMKQHLAMGPVLDEVKGFLPDAGSAKTVRALEGLLSAVANLKVMWHTHIDVEEASFGPEAVAHVLTMAERRQAAKITANHSARHQFPLSLMLPFLLYNMPVEDREIMIQLMPGFIPPMLKIWKPRWMVMAPFLMVDV